MGSVVQQLLTHRVSSVSAGAAAVSYAYWPNSDLVETTRFKQGGATQAETVRSWDYGARLRWIMNKLNNSTVNSYFYEYDTLDRRSRMELEDGSHWSYEYNDRGELVNGKRYWTDWPNPTYAAGQQFEYLYDNIGNRTKARSGGEINGGNLRETQYTPNALNQYTEIITPGYQHITGVAATTPVTVNDLTAERNGDYYSKEIALENGSGPAWTSVEVTSGAQSQTKNLLFPPNVQNAASPNPLLYDPDGNLASDGLWSYVWDAENRLIQMTSAPQVPDAAKRQLEFGYDHEGKRFKKTVKTYSGGGYGDEVTTRYIHDGWRLVAELSGNTVQRSYAWGLDLSGTVDDAAGVGGLVLITDHAGGASYFPGYDGNGNVTVLTKSTGGTVAARYEYGPFGNVIRATGHAAEGNSIRWSTKYFDEETQLVMYPGRPYSPSLGRWLSKDPAGEAGGANVYAFVLNNPMNLIDPDGAAPMNLGGGWTGRVDTFNTGGSSSFEIHVNDKAGREVGVFGPDGWINKHGHKGAPPAGVIPDHVLNKIRGEQIDRLRKSGAIPPKGRANIKGRARQMGGAHLGLLGSIATAGLVLANGEHTASRFGELATSYFQNKQRGEVGLMDLDAIDIAIEVQNLAGDSFLMYSVLGGLLE